MKIESSKDLTIDPQDTYCLETFKRRETFETLTLTTDSPDVRIFLKREGEDLRDFPSIESLYQDMSGSTTDKTDVLKIIKYDTSGDVYSVVFSPKGEMEVIKVNTQLKLVNFSKSEVNFSYFLIYD